MKPMTTLLIPAIAALNLFSQSLMAEQTTLSFEKGQMFCWVSSSDLPNNLQAQKNYFQNIGPIIQNEGVEFLSSMRVERKLAGHHDVPGFGVIKMPGIQTKININEKRIGEWQHIRETRPDIWKELRLADYVMGEDKNFTFDTEKYYQLEAFWLKSQDKLDEFVEYSSARTKRIDRAKGNLMYQFDAPYKYESLGMERAPDQFVLIEWNNKADFEVFWQAEQAQKFSYLAGYDAWLTALESNDRS